MDKIEIVIVTGMSGAGKTTAMAAFDELSKNSNGSKFSWCAKSHSFFK